VYASKFHKQTLTVIPCFVLDYAIEQNNTTLQNRAHATTHASRVAP